MGWKECEEWNGQGCRLIDGRLGWRHGIPRSVCMECGGKDAATSQPTIDKIVGLTVSAMKAQYGSMKPDLQERLKPHVEPGELKWLEARTSPTYRQWAKHNGCAASQFRAKAGLYRFTRIVEGMGDLPVDASTRVLVVGNGPSAASLPIGHLIDSFDVIVRFNDYVTKGYEGSVGSRTDIWVNWWGQVKRKKPEADVSRIFLPWNPNAEHGAKTPGWAKARGELEATGIPVERIPPWLFTHMRRLFKGRWGARQNPSSGAMAVAWLLGQYKEVWVHGFDHFKESREAAGGNHHYYEGRSSAGHSVEAETAWFREQECMGRVKRLGEPHVLLVGNGPSVRSHRLGATIDAFPRVVRCGNWEEDAPWTGTKWTEWAIGLKVTRKPPPIRTPTFIGETRKDLLPRRDAVGKTYGATQLSRPPSYPHPCPSTGLQMAAHLLQKEAVIAIHGFDHFNAVTHHYWEDGMDAERERTFHDATAEAEWFAARIKEGRIVRLEDWVSGEPSHT